MNTTIRASSAPMTTTEWPASKTAPGAHRHTTVAAACTTGSWPFDPAHGGCRHRSPHHAAQIHRRAGKVARTTANWRSLRCSAFANVVLRQARAAAAAHGRFVVRCGGWAPAIGTCYVTRAITPLRQARAVRGGGWLGQGFPSAGARRGYETVSASQAGRAAPGLVPR